MKREGLGSPVSRPFLVLSLRPGVAGFCSASERPVCRLGCLHDDTFDLFEYGEA
jgi:hypothetical protein